MQVNKLSGRQTQTEVAAGAGNRGARWRQVWEVAGIKEEGAEGKILKIKHIVEEAGGRSESLQK